METPVKPRKFTQIHAINFVNQPRGNIMRQKLDRRAIMKDAHRQWRNSQRLGLGWTWAKCMSRAWEAAKGRRVFEAQRHRVQRDIIKISRLAA